LEVSGDTLIFDVIDNGKGMSSELVAKVIDPFTTTRTTRNVGLGIPLLKQSAEIAAGNLSIESQLGKGTHIKATFELKHIDRIPVGDFAGAIKMLIAAHPEVEWEIKLLNNGESFILDTREVKQHLDGLPIGHPDVLEWIQKTLAEAILSLFGGVLDEIT